MAYSVIVGDNEIELTSVSEQKLAMDAANQDLIEQRSLETRMAAVEGYFAKIEERFTSNEKNSDARFTRIESSLEELLGPQRGVNQREKSKPRMVSS